VSGGCGPVGGGDGDLGVGHHRGVRSFEGGGPVAVTHRVEVDRLQAQIGVVEPRSGDRHRVPPGERARGGRDGVDDRRTEHVVRLSSARCHRRDGVLRVGRAGELDDDRRVEGLLAVSGVRGIGRGDGDLAVRHDLGVGPVELFDVPAAPDRIEMHGVQLQVRIGET
jgi:hypothetical protein